MAGPSRIISVNGLNADRLRRGVLIPDTDACNSSGCPRALGIPKCLETRSTPKLRCKAPGPTPRRTPFQLLRGPAVARTRGFRVHASPTPAADWSSSKSTTCWRNPHPVHLKSLGVCHGRGHLLTCSGASWGRVSGVWTSRSFFAAVQDASECVHI